MFRENKVDTGNLCFLYQVKSGSILVEFTLLDGSHFDLISTVDLFYNMVSYCVTSIYAAWHIGIALSPNFVASVSSVVVSLCIPDSFLKNGLSDLFQIWHVDLTGPQGVPYC